MIFVLGLPTEPGQEITAQEGRSPEMYTERDGVTWNFLFFSLLYSCLILPTPGNAPLTMIKYHLGQAPRLVFTSNKPILKYCVCHTVAFFNFLSKNIFFSLFNTKLLLLYIAVVGTKHCHKKACKTPKLQLITGHQYVTPSLFPFFSKRIQDICLP